MLMSILISFVLTEESNIKFDSYDAKSWRKIEVRVGWINQLSFFQSIKKVGNFFLVTSLVPCPLDQEYRVTASKCIL